MIAPNGTPKSIAEALSNGTKDYEFKRLAWLTSMIGQRPELEEVQSAHVLDFLRQRFSVSYLRAENIHTCKGDAGLYMLIILDDLARSIGVKK